jgi:hypothetical protein
LFGSVTSHAALRYYRQSLALVPLDQVVRCNEAAANAYANADASTMKYLGNDAGIHLAVAQSLIDRARESAFYYSSPQLAAGFYSRALWEFDRSVQLDPEFIVALNGYGYCYWEWWTNWRRGRTSMPPPTEISYKAEHYAREGLRIAHLRALHETKSLAANHSLSMNEQTKKNEQNLSFDEMMIEDTLAEVLLAQGRVIEAVNYLDNVADAETAWAGLTETKWDLAQAEICAAQGATGEIEKRNALKRAMYEFVNIRNSEQDLEFQPFTKAGEALDPLLWASTCPNRPDKTSRGAFPFILQAHTYEPGPSCDWSGVVARLNAGTINSPLYFHLWGGGIDRRIRVEQEKRQSILLEAPPHDRTVYFFAQLEDAAGRAISEVSVVDTFGNPKPDACRRNWITLVYSPAQKQAPTAQLHRLAGPASNQPPVQKNKP